MNIFQKTPNYYLFHTIIDSHIYSHPWYSIPFREEDYTSLNNLRLSYTCRCYNVSYRSSKNYRHRGRSFCGNPESKIWGY